MLITGVVVFHRCFTCVSRCFTVFHGVSQVFHRCFTGEIKMTPGGHRQGLIPSVWIMSTCLT